MARRVGGLTATAGTARDLIAGFEPETALEAAVAGDPVLLQGLAWGRPRRGHPEGAVGRHVADLLVQIDRSGEQGRRRSALRFIALVHDSLKFQVSDWRLHTGANHHAARARRFAEAYTADERLLAVIDLHDRPYSLWRRMRFRRRLDEAGFERMMERVADRELFVRFVELDGSTEGKDPEPIRWFREELERRGLIESLDEPDRA